MDERYRDPEISRIWSRGSQLKTWATVEAVWAAVLLQRHPDAASNRSQVETIQQATTQLIKLPGSVVAVRHADLERECRHEFVALLRLLERLGADSTYLHWGLTSSDAIDTATSIQHLDSLDVLRARAAGLSTTHVMAPMLGRTHGQPAEPVSWGSRVGVWHGICGRTLARFAEATKLLAVAKASGPTGTYALTGPNWEADLATLLGLVPAGPGHTQILQRDNLAYWAACAAGYLGAIEKVAVDLRLMSLQGLLKVARPPGYVGSSSMPGKTNLAEAERLCGFARMGRGYAQMLQPMDNWLERDLAHSCVEREAVPALWHLALAATSLLDQLLLDVAPDQEAARQELQDHTARASASAERLGIAGQATGWRWWVRWVDPLAS